METTRNLVKVKPGIKVVKIGGKSDRLSQPIPKQFPIVYYSLLQYTIVNFTILQTTLLRERYLPQGISLFNKIIIYKCNHLKMFLLCFIHTLKESL